MPRLTIGMACFNAFRDVWHVVQSLRLHHRLARESEIILVDNSPGAMLERDGRKYPTNPHGAMLMGFVDSLADPLVRYIPMPDPVGTAPPRQRIFDEARGDIVLCMDSHVLLDVGALDAVLDYFSGRDSRKKDLVSGPMLYDSFNGNPSMFLDVWRSEMRGIWSSVWLCTDCLKDGRTQAFATINEDGRLTFLTTLAPHSKMTSCPGCGKKLPAVPWHGHEKALDGMMDAASCRTLPPFEVVGQGLGAFAAVREEWPGFNREFRGFGGEELYIHEKVRRRGGRCVCLPSMRWAHCFGNPDGIKYPITLWNKVRNYIIGHRELGLPLDDVKAHFVDKLGPGIWDKLTSTHPPPLETVAPGCPTGCGGGSVQTPSSLDAWYEQARTTPGDFNEHVVTLRDLASKCDHVTEFGTRRGVSTVALLHAQPKKLVSYDLHPSYEAGKLKEMQGRTDFQFVLGDSRKVSVEETDLLFIDTVHTGQHVMDELNNAAPKVRKYIVFHDTEAPFGEVGEDGGPGVLPAVREFLWRNTQWVVKKHHRNCHGLTILSKLREDRKEMPSKLRMAWNMTVAQTRHALQGGKYLPLEVIAPRAMDCALCELRVGEQCSQCGCWLKQIPDDAPVRAGQPGKLAYPTDYCPVGKWHPAPDRAVDMDEVQVKALLEGMVDL